MTPKKVWWPLFFFIFILSGLAYADRNAYVTNYVDCLTGTMESHLWINQTGVWADANGTIENGHAYQLRQTFYNGSTAAGVVFWSDSFTATCAGGYCIGVVVTHNESVFGCNNTG